MMGDGFLGVTPPGFLAFNSNARRAIPRIAEPAAV